MPRCFFTAVLDQLPTVDSHGREFANDRIAHLHAERTAKLLAKPACGGPDGFVAVIREDGLLAFKVPISRAVPGTGPWCGPSGRLVPRTPPGGKRPIGPEGRPCFGGPGSMTGGRTDA